VEQSRFLVFPATRSLLAGSESGDVSFTVFPANSASGRQELTHCAHTHLPHLRDVDAGPASTELANW
jgi:hypothetical protein